MRAKSIVSIAMLPTVLAACTMQAANQRPFAQPLVRSEQLFFNPFDQPGERPDVLLTGLLQGRLTVSNQCIVVRSGNGLVTPLWPGGTTVQPEGSQTILRLPDGRGQAVLGSNVRIAGGAFSESDLEMLPVERRRACPPPYYVVSTVGER